MGKVFTDYHNGSIAGQPSGSRQSAPQVVALKLAPDSVAGDLRLYDYQNFNGLYH